MISKYAQKLYGLLWNKFGENVFYTKQLNFLDIFMSKTMKKKLLFILNEQEWIERIGRGKYICLNPSVVIGNFFKPKVLSLLKKTKMKWCFSALNALEVYSDFSVEHRSWISSPFYIKILEKDLKKWIKLFKKSEIPIFIYEGKPQLGEYVVLIPKKTFNVKIINDHPVETLEEVIEFTKKRSFEFAYELNYLGEKYGRTI